MTYNGNGQIKLTVVPGTSRTGLYAVDGSYNVVLTTENTTIKGLYHPCGAYWGTAVTSPTSEPGFYAKDGSMNITQNSDSSYSPFFPQGSAGGTPPPVLWTPLNLGITGTYWYNTADASKFTTGTGVASWTDSYSGFVVSQATGSQQPTRSTTSLNGNPGVSFNGTNSQSLVSAGITNVNTPFTMFAVNNYASDGPVMGGNTNGTQSLQQNGGVYEVDSQFQFALASSTNSSIAGTSAFVDFTFDGTNYAFKVNGTAAGSGTSAITFGGSYNLALGSFPNNGVYATGVIGDVLLTPAILNSSQINKMEGYEAWKFGLQGNLPAGHPYKSRAPYVSDP